MGHRKDNRSGDETATKPAAAGHTTDAGDTWAWCNGAFVPLAQAGLAWTDAGFVFGAVVVDNARTFAGRLYRWADHLARWRRHCAYCGVPLPYTDAELTAAAEGLLARNRAGPAGCSEVQLVSFATPGPLALYGTAATDGPPTVGMMTYPLPVRRYRPFFQQGVCLEVVGRQHAAAEDLLPPYIKHRSRLLWHIAQQRRRRPEAVPVVVNQYGVGDTPIGAIAAVRHGTLLLPPAGMVLESISLLVLRELAAGCGLEVREQACDLLRPEADELLLAGTAYGLAGVRRLLLPAGMVTTHDQEKTWDWPGPVYCRLQAAWNAAVGVDIPATFLQEPSITDE